MTDTATTTETVETTPASVPQTFTVDPKGFAEVALDIVRQARLASAMGPLAAVLFQGPDPRDTAAHVLSDWAILTGQSKDDLVAAVGGEGNDPLPYLTAQLEAVLEGTAVVTLKG